MVEYLRTCGRTVLIAAYIFYILVFRTFYIVIMRRMVVITCKRRLRKRGLSMG